ncbi:MAG: Nascent polypeptide-associated complex subunit beta [Chaenotheca gracillima]|nr:MAG: Nascent polypeptide-associated complex subunit beta [Chaenotheca gracillima]
MVLRKDELEAQLHAENRDISEGKIKDDNPLDVSASFRTLCEACRRGDLKVCQEMITEGVNINARDQFDYTPLILASLCGHFEVVRLLLESGALCERDTFQGERCLYNALNDRIRNLLLQYDYSKSSDPLQPLASHITSLLAREHPITSDIVLNTAAQSFCLHKFILSARSPYFRKKLEAAPETTSWKLSNAIPPRAFEIAVRYLYLGEVPSDLAGETDSIEEEQELLAGIDKISRQLEIQELFNGIIEGGDRRIARQRRADEVAKGRGQLEEWFRENIIRYKISVETSKAEDVRWSSDNGIFADVLLRADEDDEEDFEDETPAPSANGHQDPLVRHTTGPLSGIPVGPVASSRSPSRARKERRSVLFPVHRAMLLRSEFFSAMFSSPFKEAQHSEYLHIIPIDCSPAVLEVVLKFLYTEKTDFSLELAIDVLFAADLLLIEKLKVKAAVVISTLGNGSLPRADATPDTKSRSPEDASQTPAEADDEVVDIYDVIRAGWLTRVHRLEEFAARYFAYRLERYIDQEDFAELIKESAGRISQRQETDSIELLDDIRYYLSERFRLRFEDSGIDDMMDEDGESTNPLVPEDVASAEVKPPEDDEGIDMSSRLSSQEDASLQPDQLLNGAVRTLDGEIAGDEFASDAINYQLLLGKIDSLLERLKLDA